MLGNERLLLQLKTAVNEQRVAHAYLLSGAVGSGKKTLAKIMSRMFLCENGGCGSCTACNKLKLGVHPDLIELHGENKNGSYSVDQIRALRKDALVYPNESAKKVYILHDAHLFSDGAQDAFLKILEEPPEFVVFILLCSDEGRLFATILSRVIRLPLAYPDEAVTQAWLSEQVSAPEQLLQTALRVAGGNPGQALALLKQDTLTKQINLCETFCKTLLVGTAYELAAMNHRLASDKKEFAAFLKMLCLYLRDILVYKTASDTSELIFAESIAQNGSIYARMRTSGIPSAIEQIGQLAEDTAKAINITLIEMRLVTLVKEELI